MNNIGAKLLIDAALKSNEESGDGTTTCTILANSILEHGSKMLHEFEQSQYNINEVRKGIKFAVK
jgi:chaperonin GroEL (HSP60 family)